MEFRKAGLAERSRIMGLETECALLVPAAQEKLAYGPPPVLHTDLLHAAYQPTVEELPAFIRLGFLGEVPSHQGFLSFGRVYREPYNGYIEHATAESSSAIDCIRRKHEGQAYVHQVGRLLLALANNPARARWAMKRFGMPEIPAVQAIVQRTLGVDGATCGMHENYLAERNIRLESNDGTGYGPVLMSHLVTRLWSFAGGVRLHRHEPRYEFVGGAKLSAVETDYGVPTTHDKPIINTRDRPYADWERFRRNHLTSGDGGMWPWPDFMKLTTTSLVHRLVENDIDCRDVLLADPVPAARHCALPDLRRPEDLQQRIRELWVLLENGERIHPLELQLRLAKKCEIMARSCYVSPEESYALKQWRHICEQLLEDALSCQDHVEFIGKLALGTAALERRARKDRPVQLDWDAFETAWCNLDPAISLGMRSWQKLTPQRSIMDARLMPYQPTRADARKAALDHARATRPSRLSAISVDWDKLGTTGNYVSKPDPHDSDPGPWIDRIDAA